jgi:hypothetical protein
MGWIVFLCLGGLFWHRGIVRIPAMPKYPTVVYPTAAPVQGYQAPQYERPPAVIYSDEAPRSHERR